jgi:MFS family permease
MSVYAITGLILALPSGFIFQRAGYRVTGLIAGGSIVIGAVLGATSTDMGRLLVSRVVEGAGTSFMAVLAPAIIAQWFVMQRRGTAMGIWSAWVPVGSAVMLLLAPGIAAATGWRGVWWFGAAYAALVTVLYLVVVKPAPLARSAAPGGADAAPGTDSAAEAADPPLRNRNIWLLSAAFAFFNMALLAYATFLPTFIHTQRGVPLEQAALLASLSAVIPIFSAPAGGILSDRVGSRRRPFLAGFVLSALLLPLAAFLSLGGLTVLIVLLGLAAGLIPTNIFSAAVEATGDESQSGMAMAVIMVGQNAGVLLGPAIFGALVETWGWTIAFASLGVMSLGGLVAGWLARVR